MLDDDIVLRNARYWAKKFSSKHVDYSELVSIGYLVGKPLRDKRLLKDWIHYSLLKFVVSEQKKLQGDDEYILNTQYAKEHTSYADLYLAIKKAKLSKRELQTIKFLYFDGLSQVSIAKKFGVRRMTVNKFLSRAIGKIKKVLDKKEI